MKVRLQDGVKLRQDTFGGVCYVPHRDDFFAASEPVYRVIKSLDHTFTPVIPQFKATYKALAKIGVCETSGPATREEAYSGPFFLGEFQEIPTVTDPLVLNCFATAHCPLKCIYCHADDLMQGFRERENDDQLDNVISTARQINSFVVVITGGDPLTRPERAKKLLEGLSKDKALVLDTSGAGDIDALLPDLKKHHVHMRVSLDAVSTINEKARPINPAYLDKSTVSRKSAQDTIRKCLAAGLAVTVQTVVSSLNDNLSELIDLRDWIIGNGVKNWVLHVTVKGGSARRIQNEAMRKHRRVRGILPGGNVYETLRTLIQQSQRDNLPLDIRCTDTDTTPNSVLLIASDGNLYTEGYAHNGKVLLYDANDARPDTLRRLWHYVDRFGHARRYLNWNPHFYEGTSLEEICYPVPLPDNTASEVTVGGIVESEAKFKVLDLAELDRLLRELMFTPQPTEEQRDEYYDDSNRGLEGTDFVIRIRRVGNEIKFAVKGPRSWTQQGEYSRIELEFTAKSEESARKELSSRGLVNTWYFEKRRTSYRNSKSAVHVEVDEIPEVGGYAEIEGPILESRQLAAKLAPALGARDRRNYKDIYLAFQRMEGVNSDDVKGAAFAEGAP